MQLRRAGRPGDVEARAFQQGHQGGRAGLVDALTDHAGEIVEDGRGAVRHVRGGQRQRGLPLRARVVLNAALSAASDAECPRGGGARIVTDPAPAPPRDRAPAPAGPASGASCRRRGPRPASESSPSVKNSSATTPGPTPRGQHRQGRGGEKRQGEGQAGHRCLGIKGDTKQVPRESRVPLRQTDGIPNPERRLSCTCVPLHPSRQNLEIRAWRRRIPRAAGPRSRGRPDPGHR